MLTPELFEYLFKIIVSIILGGLIGIEREVTHHWAGLRTHMLVCLGATLFMFITDFRDITLQPGLTLNLDVTRVAAGVIMGIGFLGAGVIFKEGASVKGLTTAASIWVTAAVGLLVGIGRYELAVIATILILVVLYSDFFLEKIIVKSREVMFLNISIKNEPNAQDRIENIIKRKGITISLKDFKRDDEKITLTYQAIISKLYREKFTRLLLKDNKVIAISWTE